MFKLLGSLVALYTLAAAMRGEVYAKAGVSGRMVSKAREPRSFWIVIAIYIALSVALLTIF
jgi:hypothetical protein